MGKQKLRRCQKLFVLKRNDLYSIGQDGWTSQIEKADVFPEDQVERAVKINIGMPCRVVQVMPCRIDGAPVKDVS